MVQVFYTSHRVSTFGGVIIFPIEFVGIAYIYRMDQGIMFVCVIMPNMYFPQTIAYMGVSSVKIPKT